MFSLYGPVTWVGMSTKVIELGIAARYENDKSSKRVGFDLHLAKRSPWFLALLIPRLSPDLSGLVPCLGHGVVHELGYQRQGLLTECLNSDSLRFQLRVSFHVFGEPPTVS